MAGMGGEERSTVGPHHHRKAALPYQRVAPRSVGGRKEDAFGANIFCRGKSRKTGGGEKCTQRRAGFGPALEMIAILGFWIVG